MKYPNVVYRLETMSSDLDREVSKLEMMIKKMTLRKESLEQQRVEVGDAIVAVGGRDTVRAEPPESVSPVSSGIFSCAMAMASGWEAEGVGGGRQSVRQVGMATTGTYLSTLSRMRLKAIVRGLRAEMPHPRDTAIYVNGDGLVNLSRTTEHISKALLFVYDNATDEEQCVFMDVYNTVYGTEGDDNVDALFRTDES